MSASSSAVTSEVARPNSAALAFLYEHPQWFAPVFAELERRKVAFDKILGAQLEQSMSIQEYSVSNRGLRSGLVGTSSRLQQPIGRFEEAGVDLLLQFSPQL